MSINGVSTSKNKKRKEKKKRAAQKATEHGHLVSKYGPHQLALFDELFEVLNAAKTMSKPVGHTMLKAVNAFVDHHYVGFTIRPIQRFMAQNDNIDEYHR